MTRARRYTSGRTAAGPVRVRPALRLERGDSRPVREPEQVVASAAPAQALGAPIQLVATGTLVTAGTTATAAMWSGVQHRRPRPYLRALRWVGGVLSLIVLAYAASV